MRYWLSINGNEHHFAVILLLLIFKWIFGLFVWKLKEYSNTNITIHLSVRVCVSVCVCVCVNMPGVCYWWYGTVQLQLDIATCYHEYQHMVTWIELPCGTTWLCMSYIYIMTKSNIVLSVNAWLLKYKVVIVVASSFVTARPTQHSKGRVFSRNNLNCNYKPFNP